MVVDTILLQIVACGLAILFLTAGMQKCLHQQAFRGVLASYELMPGAIIPAVAVVVPLAEVATGLALLASWMNPLTIAAASLLLMAYAIAMAINLGRGRMEIDCGCQLGGTGQQISTALVIRNLMLIMATLSLLLPTAERSTTWFDYGVVAFGVLMVCLLYGTANNLIATHSRMLTQ